MTRLVGHEAVMRRLGDALERNRLAHALLFTGPDGIGKSLAARQVAAQVFCERRGTVPCGECDSCIQIAAGTHADLFTVQLPAGKKDIGVEQARQVKRFVQLKTISGARKVAVISDADRLTVAAQNALLKTLEEPPGHALIVLVTASPGALLPTVRSRCQRVLFQPLAEEEVAAILRHECGLDAAEAQSLAALAEGSPGRALRQRLLIRSETRATLIDTLAEVDLARYGSIARMSKLLGGTEPEMATRLELLLSWYRDAAVHNLTGGESVMDAATAVRCADHVAGALRILRRRNPNRPLLAEALVLRLACA